MQTLVPGIQLYGPDLGTLPPPLWLSAIASDENKPFIAITQHYYPTTYSFPSGACKGTPVPAISELLSPEVRERENAAIHAIVAAGEVAQRETRISETNATSSCDASGGPATSPVFGSALWSLDWVLRAASAGISGLNFQGYFGQCAPHGASPVCAPSNVAESRGQVMARPEYYGLVAARQLEGGRFLPVDVTGLGTSSDLTAYATMHPHAVVTLAVDDFATEGPTSLRLEAPGYDKATGESLRAPSVSATGNVTFGEVSFSYGRMKHPMETAITGKKGVFRLKLAPSSAIVIRLRR